MRKAKHGTRSMYVKGCSCARCSKANREYQRAYLAARVAAGITDGSGRVLKRGEAV